MIAKTSVFLLILVSLFLFSCRTSSPEQVPQNDFIKISENLLAEWCDGMIARQYMDPSDPSTYGALACDASDKIHGRCMDAVFPLLYQADKTGETKYLDAAIAVMKWSENVRNENGSWRVVPKENTWSGITVFGAIALGEALHYHGHILPDSVRIEWTKQLEDAAQFIYENFDMEYSHVNYPFTAIYALHLLGQEFDNEAYLNKAKQLASEFPKWMTTPHNLLYGEDKPADKRSAKGLPSVDLGYNVEETLNGVTIYALETNDEELLSLLDKSLAAHARFLIPDGGWDNSWGTRQNKWTYWGSRTTDGCQPAFAMMADRNPLFGYAAYHNLKLLEECTFNNLLGGGPHLESHGLKPCMHHTFAHAKSLAYILNNRNKLPEIDADLRYDDLISGGITHFPELDVWLLRKGGWWLSVSTYDNIFKSPDSRQVTGGAPGVVYHDSVRSINLGSMADYAVVEANNQQPYAGPMPPTTPHFQIEKNGEVYTNLYDLEATCTAEKNQEKLTLDCSCKLKNKNYESHPTLDENLNIQYAVTESNLEISLTVPEGEAYNGTRFYYPIVSKSGEEMEQSAPMTFIVTRENGNKIEIAASDVLQKELYGQERVFNLVPGVETIPVFLEFTEKRNGQIKVSIKNQ